MNPDDVKWGDRVLYNGESEGMVETLFKDFVEVRFDDDNLVYEVGYDEIELMD